MITVVAQIADGYRLIGTSGEAVVTLGTREQPGLLAEPLRVAVLSGLETNAPRYLDRTVFTPKFARNGSTNELYIRGIHVQEADRRVIVTGNFTEVNGAAQNGIVRLLADGTTDHSLTSALPAGVSVTRSELLASGSILLAGSFQLPTFPFPLHTHRLIQVGPNGAFERSFTGPISNDVTALEVQADGKILVAVTEPARLIRLRPEGFLDAEWVSPVFQNESNATIHAIRALDTGSVWIGGNFTRINGEESGSFVQLKSDGTLDRGATPVLVQGTVFAIEGDLIGGAFTNINGSACTYLARITSSNAVCVNDDFNMPVNSGAVGGILGGGRFLVSPENPLGKGHGRSVRSTDPYRTFSFTRTAVTLSGSELYMATVAFPTAQVIRFTSVLPYTQNNVSHIDWYGGHLLLRSQYSWAEQFEFSDDLVNWEINPTGLLDTNTTERARFYRIKPRF